MRRKNKPNKSRLKCYPHIESLEPRIVLDSTAVFNELMYHPSGDENSLEWIELHNQLSLDLDLTRWRLAGAVDYQFPAGTTIPGRDYLVVAVDPQQLESQTGFSGALGPFTGRLSNGGEEIQLLNNDDRLMNVLDYRDGGDWPVGPDGIGFTLAKRDELFSTVEAEHWASSQQLGGTPGSKNFVSADGPTTFELVDQGAQARFLIPTDESLDTTWTAESFDDAGWSLVATGIGYEQNSSSNIAYGNLVGASGTSPLRGPYGHDFTVNSTITVTQLGVFDSGADGLSRDLTAELWTRSGNSGTLITDLEFTTPDPGVLIGSSRFKSLAVPQVLAPGDYAIVAHGYGSSERAGHQGFGGPTSAFKTLDDGGGAISFVGTSRSGTTLGSFPTIIEPGTVNYFSAGTFQFNVGSGNEVTTDIESVMSGVNTTAYVRVPFTVGSVANFSTLTLTMKYNDGFVAFINDQEVARRNAPASLTWDSTAATNIPVITEEAIDVTAAIANLQAGSNVLAIHGLNFGVSDPRFLILPELDAVESTDVSEVVINEIAPGGSASFFVEIANETTVTQPIAGYAIVSSTGNEYVISNVTLAPGAYLSITSTEMGFIPADGDELFLLSPSRGGLADARHVTGSLRGRSVAHDNRWLYPTTETPGAPNNFEIEDDIVINEIFYHPFGQLPPNIDVLDADSLVTTTLVSAGTQATAHVPTDNSLGNSWQQPTFNDSAWTSGPTGIGFEVGGASGAIAYGNLAGANGTSPLSGPYGHDFTVNSTLSVTQLGVFDSGANGLRRELTAEIWSRDNDTSAHKLADLTFDSGNPGTLIGSNRFKPLASPLTLAPGDYSIVAHGYGSSEKAGSQDFGGPGPTFKTLDDGNGAISFVGGSRLGTTAGNFPSQLIGGSVNHFSAGTFQFSTSGFISQQIATDIETPMHGENASAYIRVEFTATAPDADQSAKLTLKMKHDDGYIVYLNGTEVARRNAPAVATFNSSATIAEEMLTFQELDISAHVNQLLTGTNVLAIQGLNVSAGDEDFLIVPELELETALKPQDEWIELYNRGTSIVDLTGWKMDGGVGFDFPAGTSIAPDSYLVVAQDAARLAATYPAVEVVGNFTGLLNNRDELIQLVDPNKNPADEVHYYQDSYWPKLADGGGSSLELRDPDADNSKPGAWADSQESDKTSWNTYTYRGVATPFESSGTRYHELVIGLLNDGEVLVDDITVVENPDGAARQLIQNPTFQSDAIGGEAGNWRIIGNHFGTVIADPDDPSNKVLHLRTTGTTEDMHNHGETTFKHDGSFIDTVPGREYEIAYRARWLGGANLFNTRLYYNSASQTTALPVPQLNGTPGAQNSRYESNIGPTYRDLIHSPTIPNSGESVTITTVATDPNDISSAKIYWRTVSGSMGTWQTSPMTIAVDGTLSGNIPGHSNSTVVQFYVAATDSLGGTSTFPPAGPESGALYKVLHNRVGGGLQHRLRIIQPIDDINFQLQITNRMSNHRFPGTIIFNERDIYYDVGIRFKGSSASRSHNGHGYNMRFHTEKKYLGVHQNISFDRETLNEMLIKQINNRADGIPSMYNDSVYLIDPLHTSKNGLFILRMAGYSNAFLDEQFRDGGNSMLIDKDIDYRPNNTTGGPEGGKIPAPWTHTNQGNADIGNNFWGTDKDAYRLRWRTKNHRTRDDFSQIVKLNEVYRLQGTIPDDQWNDMLNELIDVDQWLRVLAMVNLAGVTDYLNQSAWNHNYLLYPRPDTGQLVMLPWDLDIAYGSSAPVTGTGPHTRTRAMVTIPENLRLIYGHYDNLIATAYNGTYAQKWASHLNGMYPGTDFTGPANYITSRANSVASQLPDKIAFEITTHSPHDVDSDNTATIHGQGWVDVRGIRLAGADLPLDIDWTVDPGASYAQTWSTTVSLTNGTNDYTFAAYDFQGNLITTDTIQISTTGGDETVDSLRITEINYNPSAPTMDELAVDSLLNNDDFEFIEVQNTGTQSINLQNVAFTNGIDFTFSKSNLSPGQYGLIVQDLDAFQIRYGAGANILGSFSSGRLSNNGENLSLVIGLNNILDFSYNDTDPWPERTDGHGATLELVDPVGTPVDQYGKHYHWRASTEWGGTPGTAGAGPIGVVVNEILAHADPPVAVSDSIELLNTTSSPIDISGWYLSDSSANFRKYQIPGGSVLVPGEYLVFDETDFNPNPLSPAANHFSLSDTYGDDVWLTIPDTHDGISAFIDDVHFDDSANGESFGRTPNGTGRLAPMTSNTLGGNNSAPRVGPLIIAEVNYNPGNPSTAALAVEPTLTGADLEYLEIHNPTKSPVDLTNWRIRGGIEFDFEAGTLIAGGETLVLISFNPDRSANATRINAFRAHFGIDTSPRLVGGFTNRLGNGGDRIELQRPGTPPPESPGTIPRLEEDQVLFDDLAPWPTTADAAGDSLHRTLTNGWGSDPTSWTAAVSTPGRSVRPGDTNLDGDVDTEDLTTAIINFTSAGGIGKTWADGDVDGDGDVDTSDLTTAIVNFTGALSAPVVPAGAIALVTAQYPSVEKVAQRVTSGEIHTERSPERPLPTAISINGHIVSTGPVKTSHKANDTSVSQWPGTDWSHDVHETQPTKRGLLPCLWFRVIA